MSLWYPPEFEHNKLLNLLGDAPYYHVSETIYQALREFGGFTPSLANPFATVSFVDAQVAAGRMKTAWGRVGSTPYGGSSSRYVNIQTGVSNDGSYFGDIGFTEAPSVVVSVGNIAATNTDHHGFAASASSVTSAGFYVNGGAYDAGIGFIHWLCVGR